MTLKHTEGNLITLAEQGNFDIIVHGCNCQNTMGSGIAREIRTRYPGAYLVDCRTKANDMDKLGTYTKYDTGTFTIVNAYTQFDYLPRGIDHFDYDGFTKICGQLATDYPNAKFGFPYIGMGLAGGNETYIMAILDSLASIRDVTLVKFMP